MFIRNNYFGILSVCLWIFFFLGAPSLVVAAEISVENCRIRLIPSKEPRAAGYMTLINHGPKDRVLISISSEKAKRVEVHKTSMDGGMAKMGKLEELLIPSGGSVLMASGAIHLMFTKISPDLKFGDTAILNLHFKDGKSVAVEAKVVSIFQDMEMSMKHK